MKEKIKVLMVCHGNICRSPLAEFIMKHIVNQYGLADQFYIASAATSTEEIGNDVHRGSKAIMQKYKIPFGPRAARQMTPRDYSEYDYLIGMDTANIRNMHRVFGGDPEEKVYKLLSFAEYEKTGTLGEGRDVADPWYTGDFEATYRDVVAGCKGLFSWLKHNKT